MTYPVLPRKFPCGRWLALGLAVVVLGGAAGPARALEPGEFDPALLDSLLAEYVREDGVEYARWRADGTEALDRFLAAAGDYDLGSAFGKEPRGGFLINAYNAWAIRQVLEHYPVKSLEDIPGFRDGNAVRIAGEERTLDAIEDLLGQILRPYPRFAFVLAPGAVGMPPLAPHAYTSEGFPTRLKRAAGSYLGTPGRVYYDEKTELLHLPPQFDRHRELFDNLPKGIADVLAEYLPLSDLMAVAQHDPERVYDPVDWTLREAAGDETPGEEPAENEEP